MKAEADAERLEKKKAAANAKTETPADSEDDWSIDQQKQMETKMKEIPQTMATKERWIQIADGVTGKTPKERFTRYKELVKKAKDAHQNA